MAIKVSGTTVIDDDRNISNVGIITATSFSGDGSNITGIVNAFQSIASGTLPDGSPVLINSDGTVSAASSLPGKTPITLKNTIPDSPSGQWNSIAHDTTNNKLIWAYRGTDNYGYVTVGDIDGITINFGTPVVFKSETVQYVQVVYDSGTDRIVIFDDNGDTYGFPQYSGAYRVGQISGTSVTFGTPVATPDNGIGNLTVIGQGTSGTFVTLIPQTFFYTQYIGVVGTITGGSTNSISFGTTSLAPCSINSGTDDHVTITPFNDSGTDKIVVAYRDFSTSRGSAIVGTQSGTTLTFGTSVEFYNNFTRTVSQTYDTSTNRVVVAYKDDVNDDLAAVVGQVSGNSISFGSPTVFTDNNSATSTAIAYDPDENKVVIGFSTNLRNKGYVTIGTVTGGTTNSISFASTTQYTENSAYTRMLYDSFNNQTILATEYNTINERNAFVVKSNEDNTNLTEGNFIGFSSGSYTNGQTASVKIISNIGDAQTGLTAGSKYYVQRDGSLSTTPFIPSVFAGTAIASNKIIVKQ